MNTFKIAIVHSTLGALLVAAVFGCSAREPGRAEGADQRVGTSKQAAITQCTMDDICETNREGTVGNTGQGSGGAQWWTGLGPSDPLSPFVTPVVNQLPANVGIIVVHGGCDGGCVQRKPTAEELAGMSTSQPIINGACYGAKPNEAGCSFTDGLTDLFTRVTEIPPIYGCTGPVWYYRDGRLHCQGQWRDRDGNPADPGIPGVTQGDALPAGDAQSACDQEELMCSDLR